MDAWLFQASKEIEDATLEMTAEQVRGAPTAKWNSAQILEHLARAFGGTAKMLEQRLASESIDPVPSPTPRQRLAVFVVCTIGYMPGGRTAPSMTAPTGLDGLTALRRIHENLERMDRALSEAERRWGRKVPIAVHPVLGPFKVDQWRRFHYVHTRHHMKQIRDRRLTAGIQSVPTSSLNV